MNARLIDRMPFTNTYAMIENRMITVEIAAAHSSPSAMVLESRRLIGYLASISEPSREIRRTAATRAIEKANSTAAMPNKAERWREVA